MTNPRLATLSKKLEGPVRQVMAKKPAVPKPASVPAPIEAARPMHWASLIPTGGPTNIAPAEDDLPALQADLAVKALKFQKRLLGEEPDFANAKMTALQLNASKAVITTQLLIDQTKLKSQSENKLAGILAELLAASTTHPVSDL